MAKGGAFDEVLTSLFLNIDICYSSGVSGIVYSASFLSFSTMNH